MVSLLHLLVVLCVSVASVCVALVLLRLPARPAPPPDTSDEVSAALLFDGDALVDATLEVTDILGVGAGAERWADVRPILAARFADVPAELNALAQGTHYLAALHGDDTAFLCIERDGPTTRIALSSEASHDAQMEHLASEHRQLSRALNTSPHPCWQTDGNGRVTWHNAAYTRLAEAAGKPVEDPVPVFADGGPMDGPTRKRRVSVRRASDGETMWYDLVQQRNAPGLINHGVDIAPVIKAEIAQRNFVQTLAKTFAQLSIGLAIFDRNRQLALFNPALVDLTRLPAEFLSSKPDLLSFFDRLREERMMPEPKSYTSWRQEIASVIAAANDGRYQETWNLETGQTFRVSGRPHPDKAIAFLIEDISAEVMLTRNFRIELEMGQSLMDSLDDPIVVFSASGILTFCNQAYRDLFDVDPESSFADVTVLDAMKDWQRIARPTPELADIRDFIQQQGQREMWTCEVSAPDGRRWTCHVQPIAVGATAIRFAEVPVFVEAAQ